MRRCDCMSSHSAMLATPKTLETKHTIAAEPTICLRMRSGMEQHAPRKTRTSARHENAEKVQIDVAGYRFDEQDKLADKAKKAAEQVRRWGDIVELEPMNSYDRRIIHNTLKDDPDIETQSVEVDGTLDKAIILRPKN